MGTLGVARYLEDHLDELYCERFGGRQPEAVQ